MFAAQHRGSGSCRATAFRSDRKPACDPGSSSTLLFHPRRATAEFARHHGCCMESPPTQWPRARPGTLAALAAGNSRRRARWRIDAAVRRLVSAASRHCAGGFYVSARQCSGGRRRVPVRHSACCVAWVGGVASGNHARDSADSALSGWPRRRNNDRQFTSDRHRCRDGEAACFTVLLAAGRHGESTLRCANGRPAAAQRVAGAR